MVLCEDHFQNFHGDLTRELIFISSNDTREQNGMILFSANLTRQTRNVLSQAGFIIGQISFHSYFFHYMKLGSNSSAI